MSVCSVSSYWWREQQVSISQASAQEFAKKLVEKGAEAVFKASDLDGDGTLSQEEFSLAIADQELGFAKFEVQHCCCCCVGGGPGCAVSF